MTDEGFIYEEVANGSPLKMWTKGVHVEDVAKQQLRNTAQLPFIYKHVAVMPDVHWGMGATVGSVIATKRAVIPAAVGVDIGCGMVALQTSLTASDLPDDLKHIRHSIERGVPVGAKSHSTAPKYVENVWYGKLKKRYEDIERKHPEFAPRKSAALQLGTLGGGNHFIELCLDEVQGVWIMLHSGSRNIGKRIADFFISAAKEDMERRFIKLPDKDLAYFTQGDQLFEDYVEAVSWAQDYAYHNREVMMQEVLRNLVHYYPDMHILNEVINCHHNYVEREHHFGENVWITRKGAVRARENDLGIIPGSMGTRSYIVRGKGNAQSFHSCSHGAGRRMSRGEAKRQFTLEDHIRDTEGVECRKDEGVIDETPRAYKDIDQVIAAQSDLIEVVHTLKQVLCVKG